MEKIARADCNARKLRRSVVPLACSVRLLIEGSRLSGSYPDQERELWACWGVFLEELFWVTLSNRILLNSAQYPNNAQAAVARQLFPNSRFSR